MDLWESALAVALTVRLSAAVYAALGTSVLDWDLPMSINLALAFGPLPSFDVDPLRSTSIGRNDAHDLKRRRSE